MKLVTKYGEKILACLIPINESGITCHEKTLCDCEVMELLQQKDEIIKDSVKIMYRLTEFGSTLRMVQEIKAFQQKVKELEGYSEHSVAPMTSSSDLSKMKIGTTDKNHVVTGRAVVAPKNKELKGE